MARKFYITSAIPYVNAPPHVGHALEYIQTDAIARYHKLLGYDILMLCGGDENALKNVQAAEKAGVPIQEFVDRNTQLFLELSKKLNCQYNVWQKGSDQKHHFPSSQKLWELCAKNGDIYRKSYEGLYCVGCEAFYTPEELNENGQCFEHPGKKLEKVSEENYFFRLSKYQQQLVDLISSDMLSIIPVTRKNEVLSFLKQPLLDISISRSTERTRNWGVPVPGDDTQRMYVWFDALNIYQSGIGFGWNDEKYNQWWPADIHVIGKGITRFHAIYWPSFLLSAGLRLPKKIFVHEYFTVNGQKMSKTLGNVIDPFDLVKRYGADPLRYYFLAKFSPFNDGDFSEVEFKTTYNADLANGLGNLVARIAKVAEGLQFSPFEPPELTPLVGFGMSYQFDIALHGIWERIKQCDILINEKQIWKLTGQEKQSTLAHLVNEVRLVGFSLQPFLPQTAEKILEQFKGPTIISQPPLFPRLS